MPINLNVSPYFDDFDPAKNYHKILFVPGRPIQSRELTQIQSLLQHQVQLHGDYMFKNGAMIVPGNINFLNNVVSIRLKDIYNGVLTDTYISQFVGKTISGGTTSVRAIVIHTEQSTANDPPVLFVRYISGGVVGSTYYKDFTKDEILTLEDDTTIKTQVENSSIYSGLGALATIDEGVYYINGYFVQNTKQIITLEKFSATPTYRVGLDFVDNIVTSSDDPSLRDPAYGSSNFGANGADRYEIVLTLAKKELFESQETSTTTSKFIDLLHVKDGVVQYKVNKTDLSEFEKTLARRTYDESGDYVVQPFKFTVHEYRNNNRGTWTTNTVYVQNDIVSYTVNSKLQYFVALTNGISGVTAPNDNAGEHNDGGITWLATNSPAFNTGFHESTVSESLDTQMESSALGTIKISSGKAYIKGFEIEVTGYRTIQFNKAREFKRLESQLIANDSGSYLIVDNVVGLPSFTYVDANNKPLDLITIKNAAGTNAGTCRVRNVEYYSGTVGQAACQYKAYLFDINMNAGLLFAQDAKQLSFTDTGVSFSAKVVGTRTAMSGTVKTTGSSSTLNGDGTLFSIEFVVGDTVVIAGSSYKISSIANSVSMVLDRALNISAATPIYLEKTELKGSGSLIKAMPNRYVRSLRGSDDSSINVSYHISRLYQATSDGSGVIVIDLINSGETFNPTVSSTNYQITTTAGSTVTTITGALTNSNTRLTVSGLANNTSYRISTSIEKRSFAAAEKQKIRKVNTLTLTTLNSIDKAFIQLSEADCVSLVSVTQSGGTLFDFANRTASVAYSVTNETDITSYYKLDSGQTPYYYGLGKLVPQSGFIPSAPIKVTYEYYDHTDGDYFSVNSYDVPYDMLPVIGNMSASDYIDFRPRIADTGTNFAVVNGASLTEPISSIYTIETDYSYYLPRRDILQVDGSGNFRIEEGIPSDTPVAPLPNEMMTVLAYIDVDPYTYNSSANCVHVSVNPLRRYTMKDIGSIDNRLENVEYYTALSALEKETNDLQVKDEFGLDRFKNGFIVDQFKDHGVGDVNNPDYKCAIDEQNLEMRPAFNSTDTKLIESAVQSRTINHYQVTGDIITLPYSETPIIEQRVATGAEYVTPFTHIRTSIGVLKVYPASDTWTDTETLPEVIQKSEGNFNAINAMARATGVIGTVWNSWQEVGRTTVGTSLSSSSSTSRRTNLWWNIDTTVTTTTLSGTDNIRQQRSGTESFIQERWDEVGRTTSIVDEKWAPFMRQKAIVLYSKKMMPTTKFKAYIDNNDVTKYIVPADTIRFTSKSGTFLNYQDSGNNQSDLSNRQYGTNAYDILERGEIVKGITSGATAIVITEEKQNTNGTIETVLKVVNKKGTFTSGETIVGQMSGATAVFSSYTTESLIVESNSRSAATNSAGSFYGILMLPNNTELKIPAGIITISLRDNPIEDNITTKSNADYNGQGLILSKQTNIMSVRNGTIATRQASESRNITENWSTVVGQSTSTSWSSNWNWGGGGRDPLAQTFKHSDVGGVFITSVDLYFYDVPEKTVEDADNIFLRIHEVVNGYPGPTIIPFSQVTKAPRDITASTTSLIPTNFKFESPVYLEDNKEYCIIVGSGYSNSRIWISKMGELAIDGNLVTKQPNMGSFFRSQNLSTWEADQLTDMCFTLHKAVFDNSQYGHVSFNHNTVSSAKLDIHPIKVNANETVSRVWHRNHGLENGDLVTFSGATSLFAHPTAAELNRQFTVANVDTDSYTITLPVAASSSGWIGGSTITATQNAKMDVMYFNGNDFVLPSTHINYVYRSTSRKNNITSKSTTEYPLQIRRNVYFNDSQYLLSTENIGKHLSNENSLSIEAFLYSDNVNLSPVIDLETFSVHSISNRINSPVSTNLSIDTNIILNNVMPTAGVEFDSAGYFRITDATKFDEFSGIKVGCYVQFSAAATDTLNATNKAKLLVTKAETDNSTYFKIYTSSPVFTQTYTESNLTLKQYENYIDFIAPDETSNLHNYVSKIVTLTKQSSGFKLLVDYNKPTGVEIDVYYKIDLKSSYKNLAKENWIKVGGLSFLSEANRDKFTEKEIDLETEAYDQITIKIVGKSSNTAKVPRFKNMRLLALA